MTKKFSCLILLLIAYILPAEDKKEIEHSVYLNTEYAQIKDEFNYGLVFSGPDLELGYTLFRRVNKSVFIYSPALYFGVNFNKGMGVFWGVKPIDLFLGTVAKESDRVLFTIGGYLSDSYSFQQYPELQSGHMFWYTSIETGPKLLLTIPFKNRKLNLSFSNSLAGFTSRPEPGTETYFYSLLFSDFIRNSHSNFTFGSFGTFNHTIFNIHLNRRTERRCSIGYEFEYFGYYREPVVHSINHALTLTWRLGKI